MTTPSSVPPSVSPPGSRRVLIVDDEAAIGALVASVARGLGHEVEVGTDPEWFLERCRTWDPTHLVLDLAMPGMDGMEVVASLATMGNRANLVLTSGLGARVLDAAARTGLARGLPVVGTLAKPYPLGELRRLLSTDPTQPRPLQFPVDVAVDVAALAAALAEGGIDVAYQPKVACASGHLVGFEALARWDGPDGTPVPPDRFVPAAEDAGLVDRLLDVVMDRALAWLAETGDASLGMAVNVSARSLDAHLIDRLTSVSDLHGIAPDRIVLELTETSATADPLGSLDLLTRLRVHGFRLSLDDFGTGFSSMVQLSRLPFSEIKVDRTFVARVLRYEEARTLVTTTIELAHRLGLVAVAEGVEDAETLAFLTVAGCDYAQGYHIARPMPGPRARAWLADQDAATDVDRR